MHDDLIARLREWQRHMEDWLKFGNPERSEGVVPMPIRQHAMVKEAADALEAMQQQLRLFTGAAYPVSTEIDPRGYRWSEAYLDAALAAMNPPAGSAQR